MAKLVIITDDRRAEYELQEVNTIGRHPDNTIQILDRIISKEHCAITKENGTFVLRDLGSMNGTFVNSVRVDTAPLKDGDEVSMGSTRLVFYDRKTTDTSVLSRVTIAPGMVDSHIRTRLEGEKERRFVPADQVTDLAQLRRDYEKLRIAHELNQAVGLEPDVDKLLTRILDETFKLLPANRGVILLVDPDTQELVPRAIKQKGSADENIILSTTIINEVVQNKAAVLTSDAMVDSRFSGAHSIIMQGIRSTMCVPMIHHDELMGIVHLDSRIATNAFSDKDLQILTGVASQAAQALDNAYKARQIERNALARRDFERLLPAEIVEQIVAGQVQLVRGGELRETTLLFSDIRGFTAWSEKHEPQYIVGVLNEYFELMVDVIYKHHGTLDKFMGDGIMALFGAPLSHGDDAFNAVHCSLEMMQVLKDYNAARSTKGEEPVVIGIGLNTGPVIAGYMGSSKSMEYTAIGDHVNLAARLCAVAEPGQILFPQETLSKVKGRVDVKALPPVQVKGKRHPIPIYEVMGLSATPLAQAEGAGEWMEVTGVGGNPYRGKR
ncbi:MAG TPA: adenylate/guanylate cyclase domain-containing protein [Myxococcota bacterium]|jgi:adenylate cyclase|nr:adenylate/guanylate cyclase domain-containing protein [Myxococcota bacterium]